MMEPYVIHFAPLQGYTDSVYREAHAQIFGGVETYYTPFVRLEKTGFRNKELRDLVPDVYKRQGLERTVGESIGVINESIV